MSTSTLEDYLHEMNDQYSNDHKNDDESDHLGDEPQNGKRQPDREKEYFEECFHDRCAVGVDGLPNGTIHHATM